MTFWVTLMHWAASRRLAIASSRMDSSLVTREVFLRSDLTPKVPTGAGPLTRTRGGIRPFASYA
jgi:hypothetical protein